MVMDLKSGKLKKDIKLDKTNALYTINFKYSEDGKKYIKKVFMERYLKQGVMLEVKMVEVLLIFLNMEK